MKRGIRKITYGKWTDSITITVISAFIGLIFYLACGRTLFEMFISNTQESDVLTYYYCIENRNSSMADFDTNIVLFDISGEKSRVEIANAIKKISRFNPKAIGIDIIFSEASEVNFQADSILKSTLGSLPAVVMACRAVRDGNAGTYQLEHSFFTEPENLNYGLVNANNISGYESSYPINGTQLPAFTSVLTGIDGVKKNKAVNFCNRQFEIIHISEEILPADIEQKIVLVGDLKDLRDMHDSGFPVNGSQRIAGNIINAFTISSLIHNNWITKAPIWLSLVIGIIATYLSTVLFFWLKQRFLLGSLAERLIQITEFIIVTFLGYLLFTLFSFSVNIIFSLIGVALMGLSMDILEFAGKKLLKKEEEK